MAKDIIYGEDARKALQTGIDKQIGRASCRERV